MREGGGGKGRGQSECAGREVGQGCGQHVVHCGCSKEFASGQGWGAGTGPVVILRSLVFILWAVTVVAGLAGEWQGVPVTPVIRELTATEPPCRPLPLPENSVPGMSGFWFQGPGCRLQDGQACWVEGWGESWTWRVRGCSARSVAGQLRGLLLPSLQ